MQDIVLQTIKKHHMLAPDETVYIAVSGGQDSVCLLHFMAAMRIKLKLKLGVIHINHNLRGDEALKDVAFVKALAGKYNFHFVTQDVDVAGCARVKKLSIEDAARQCRYLAFAEIAQKLSVTKIAVAHTKDDQAETTLMRIIRGTGLKGFRTIHPIVNYQNVQLIRPFLDVSRAQIEQYSAQHKVQFRIDMSNKSVRFFRNKIRHELLPLLENEYNPQIKASLSRMNETVADDYQYLNAVAQETFAECVKKERKDLVVLNKKAFMSLHTAIQYRVLLEAMQRLYPHFNLPWEKWSSFRNCLNKKSRYNSLIGKGITLGISYNDIVIQRKQMSVPYEYYLNDNDRVYVKEAEMAITCKSGVKPHVASVPAQGVNIKELLDPNGLTFPLTVRNRKNGDKMRPLGMEHMKKIKDILIDKKIPRHIRDDIPVIVSKDTIVWCWGIGIAETCKLTQQTKSALQLSVESK